MRSSAGGKKYIYIYNKKKVSASHVMNTATTSWLAREFNGWTVQRVPWHADAGTNHPRTTALFLRALKSPAEPQSGAARVTRGRDPEPPFTNSSTAHHAWSNYVTRGFFFSSQCHQAPPFFSRTCRSYCFTTN